MADIEHVLDAVYQMVIDAVYPNGTSSPSIANVPVTIVKGWPIKNKLDDAMKLGQAIVSIFPTNMQKDITVFERIEKTVSITAPSLNFQISDLTITVTGIIQVPQSVIVTVDRNTYQYAVINGDTLNSVAAAIAALIPGASAIGNVITLAEAYGVIINIATPAVAALDLGRQEQQFMISCWCPNPTIRAALAPPIDNYMRINYQFPLPIDNFNIMIFYQKTNYTDKLEVPLIYRRDLFYKIQYSTTQLNNYTTIAKTVTNYRFTSGGL